MHVEGGSQCVVAADAIHPSIIAQMTLHEGEYLLFVLKMAHTSQTAYALVEQELPRRDFEAELAYTLHCWRQWLAGCTYHGPYAEKHLTQHEHQAQPVIAAISLDQI